MKEMLIVSFLMGVLYPSLVWSEEVLVDKKHGKEGKALPFYRQANFNGELTYLV